MAKAGGESLQEPILHNADAVAGFPESGRKTFRIVGRAADVRRINACCYYKPHSTILAGFEDSAKDFFPHIFCYRVPIVLLQDHRTRCGDDRKPRGHCLNERIPHTLRTRGANEYIGGSQILWHLVMAYLPHELHASFKL